MKVHRGARWRERLSPHEKGGSETSDHYTDTRFEPEMSNKGSIPSTRSNSASPSLSSILLSSYLHPPSDSKHLFRQATHTPHTQWVVVCVLKFVGYPFKIGPDHPVSQRQTWRNTLLTNGLYNSFFMHRKYA